MQQKQQSGRVTDLAGRKSLAGGSTVSVPLPIASVATASVPCSQWPQLLLLLLLAACRPRLSFQQPASQSDQTLTALYCTL
jgi:hypothetical protein